MNNINNTSQLTPTPSSTTFDEGQWVSRWNGAAVKHSDCIRALREVYQAPKEYWLELADRILEAVKEHRLKLEDLQDFKVVAFERHEFQTDPSVLERLRDPAGYERARCLKDCLVAVRFALGGDSASMRRRGGDGKYSFII
jgi:hypothetical protein